MSLHVIHDTAHLSWLPDPASFDNVASFFTIELVAERV